MMSFSALCVLIVFTSGLMSFFLNLNHLLNSLLSLELISLSVYWAMSCNFVQLGVEVFFIMFFLVMIVCEGVLGLSLLISSVQSHGSDYMKSFSSLVC